MTGGGERSRKTMYNRSASGEGVDQAYKPKLNTQRGHYDANYGNFRTKLYEEVRRDAFGEDIGQNSWLTAGEQDRFRDWLMLSPGKRMLDIACGAGGPTLRIAALTGASVVGLDVHEQAIKTANLLAAERALVHIAEFCVADAAQPLPFTAGSFEAVTCIDAINHLTDRSSFIAECRRVLKVGGRLLFTDPTVVTGPLTSAEIAVRVSPGLYLLVPRGYDEEVISQCGLRLLAAENVTQNMADVAAGRRAARESRAPELREIEGDEPFAKQQEFLKVVNLLAREGRLSRLMFVAEKAE